MSGTLFHPLFFLFPIMFSSSAMAMLRANAPSSPLEGTELARRQHAFIGTQSWCSHGNTGKQIMDKNTCEHPHEKGKNRHLLCAWSEIKQKCSALHYIKYEENDECPQVRYTWMKNTENPVNLCTEAYRAGFDLGLRHKLGSEIVGEELTRPFNPFGIFKNRPEEMLPKFRGPSERGGSKSPNRHVLHSNVLDGGLHPGKAALAVPDNMPSEMTLGTTIEFLWELLLSDLGSKRPGTDVPHPILNMYATTAEENKMLSEIISKCSENKYNENSFGKKECWDITSLEFKAQGSDTISKVWTPKVVNLVSMEDDDEHDPKKLLTARLLARQPFMHYNIGQIVGYLYQVSRTHEDVKTFRLHKFPMRVDMRYTNRPAPFCQQSGQSFHIDHTFRRGKRILNHKMETDDDFNSLAGGAPAYFVVSNQAATAFLVGEMDKILDDAQNLEIDVKNLKEETNCKEWNEEGGDQDQSQYKPGASKGGGDAFSKDKIKENPETACKAMEFVQRTFATSALDVSKPVCKNLEEGIVNKFVCHVIGGERDNSCPAKEWVWKDLGLGDQTGWHGVKEQDVCKKKWDEITQKYTDPPDLDTKNCNGNAPLTRDRFGFSKNWRKGACENDQGTDCFETKAGKPALKILVDHQQHWRLMYMGPYQLHTGFYVENAHVPNRMFMRFQINGGQSVHHED